MAIKCVHCNGSVKAKGSKIALAVGGSALMAPLAAAVGLKAGLIALAIATFHGNRQAGQLLKLKLRLMKASHELGTFFVCKECGCDASIGEVFSQL